MPESEDKGGFYDTSFQQNENGFNVYEPTAFLPLVDYLYASAEDVENGAKEKEGAATGFKVYFNQSYIYNRISDSQMNPAYPDRKISNMGEPNAYELPLQHDYKFFVETRISKYNFLIDTAKFTGITMENGLADEWAERHTDHPHVFFEDDDKSGEYFTGYYPIARVENGDILEFHQRGDLVLDKRQFSQKGEVVDGLSAHVIVKEGRFQENLPNRVRNVVAGTGVYITHDNTSIIINATGTGDWSGENIGGGAQVYDEYTLMPAEFRTLTGNGLPEDNGQNNTTVLIDPANGDQILISGGHCINSGDGTHVYVDDSIRPFKFRGIGVSGPNISIGLTAVGTSQEKILITHTEPTHDTPTLQEVTDEGSTTTTECTFGSAASIGSSPISVVTKSSSANGISVYANGDTTNEIVELKEDTSDHGVVQVNSTDGATSVQMSSNSSSEGTVTTSNAAGDQATNVVGADGAGNATYTQTNSAGTTTNQIAAKDDTDTYLNAGPVAIGSSSTVAGRSLYVEGTTRIQDPSTAGDGTLEFGNDATHSIAYTTSNNALTVGAGITQFDADHGGQIDLYSTNAASYSAQDAYIIGSSPATGSAILAGSGNSISGHFNSIVAGANNTISGKSMNFIGGGSGIDITDSEFSVSVGGRNNDISGSSWSVLGGGYDNLITGGNVNTIGGGYSNEIRNVFASVIAGGYDNTITGTMDSAIVIAGGVQNKIEDSQYGFIGAGASNTITNSNGGVIVGGLANTLNGRNSFIGGGQENVVSGEFAVALGSFAKIKEGHDGSFVFSDATFNTNFSTGSDTMVMGFKSGVFIESASGLYVNGNAVLTGETPEGDTLQTVTDRGNVTTNSVRVEGQLQVGPNSSSSNGELLIRGQEANIILRGLEGSDKGHTIREDAGTLAFSANTTLSGTDGVNRFNIQTGASFFTERFGVQGNGVEPKFYLASVGGGAHNKATYLYNPSNSADFRIALDGSHANSTGDIGTDAFTIQSSTHNVGIGTTGPNQLLHVDGKTQLGTNGFTEGGLIINYASLSETKGGAATLLGNAVYAGTTNNTFRRTKGDAGNYILMTYNRGIAFHTNVTGNTSDDYSIDNHEQMRITTGGNVGIGTTSPAFTTGGGLEIEATTATLRLQKIGGDAAELNMGASSFDIRDLSAGNINYYVDNDIKWKMNADGLHSQDRNNGISFYGNSSLYHGIVSRNALGSAADDIRINSYGSVYINLDSNYNNNAGADFAIGRHGEATSTIDDTSLFYLNGENGNVGIGTTDPAHHLEVTGSLRADSIVIGTDTVYEHSLNLHNDGTIRIGNAEMIDKVGNDLELYQGKLYIQNDGNVRIGTNTNFPAGTVAGGKLDVRGDSDGQLLFDTDGGSSDIKSSYNLELWADYDNNNSAGYSNIYFKTDGDNTRMTIDNNGNVGIGTTSPDQSLEVNIGSVSSNESVSENQGVKVVADAGGSIGYAGYLMDLDNSTADASAFMRLSRTAGTAFLGLDIGSQSTDGIRFSTHATNNFNNLDEAMRITADGNVGIGTTDPATKLSVFSGDISAHNLNGTSRVIVSEDGSTTWNSLVMESDGASNNTHFYTDGTSNAMSINSKGATSDIVLSARQHISFKTNNGGTLGGGGERMRITSAGEVGIGTTNPTTTFHVDGNVVFSESGDHMRLRLVADASDQAIIYFGDPANNYQGRVAYQNSNDSLYFYTAGAEKMRILSGGNVGIGTASPSKPLHVIGDIKSSAGIIASRAEISSDVRHAGDENTKMSFDTDTIHLETNGSKRLTVDSAGSVGIGTSGPSAELDVNGEIRAESSMTLGADGTYGTTYGAIGIGTTNLTNGHHRIFAKSSDHMYFAAATSKGFRFRPNGGATSASAGVTIASDGDVGIGTTAPSSKLEVQGTVQTQVYAIGSLPSASPAGQRAMVNDASSSFSYYTVGQTIGAGGSYVAPVYSDGSNWRYG